MKHEAVTWIEIPTLDLVLILMLVDIGYALIFRLARSLAMCTVEVDWSIR